MRDPSGLAVIQSLFPCCSGDFFLPEPEEFSSPVAQSYYYMLHSHLSVLHDPFRQYNLSRWLGDLHCIDTGKPPVEFVKIPVARPLRATYVGPTSPILPNPPSPPKTSSVVIARPGPDFHHLPDWL